MKSASDSVTEVPLPAVSEEDILEVERRWGVVFDPPRRAVLGSNESFDVLACPGSGKTTLLVAKLAILAKKWPHSRRGICVLSHTNVARKELEGKLLGAGGGERLLDYPHFVGTIHGFVNAFLALPLLRSEGRPVRLIDDDACFSWMKRHLLAEPFCFGLGKLAHKERTLNNLIHGLVCSGNPDSMMTPAGLDARKWSTLKYAKRAAMACGFYYHADMLALAERLLREQPQVAAWARWRFPAILIDETQDTSELQSHLLAQVFPTSGCSLRQRFGDSNQAIYDRGQARATTDAFPGSEIRWITDSQRFGQTIAAKAQPLAPDQPQPHLIGSGPPRARFPELSDQEPMPHTAFFFSVGSENLVLPAFAQLLLEVFPAETLLSGRFLARAIGFVGRSGGEAGEKREKVPRSLCDYWAEYEPRASKLEPRPEKLADFIHLAQRQRDVTMDCAPAVATVVRGIAELIELIVPNAGIGQGRTLRSVRDLLATDRHALHIFDGLIWKWCVDVTPLSKTDWPLQLRELRKALTPVIGNHKTEVARPFCEWSADFAEGTSSGTRKKGLVNRYEFPDKDPRVAIDVGTIHSAKGQTHTATLVLETFSWVHDIGDLLDWLVGERCGVGKERQSRRLDRLRLVYTAMTRPTHLLCLAMRERVLDANGNRKETIEAFRSRGWQVKLL